MQRPEGVLVSPEDEDLFRLKWWISPTGYVTRSGWIVCRETGKISRPAILLHRLVLERKLGRPLLKREIVDHRNRDRLDNRRENLRVATNSQNVANIGLRAVNTSGHTGVRRLANRWRAQISYGGKARHIGMFEEIGDAVAAYKAEAERVFGEFAPHLADTAPVVAPAPKSPAISYSDWLLGLRAGDRVCVARRSGGDVAGQVDRVGERYIRVIVDGENAGYSRNTGARIRRSASDWWRLVPLRGKFDV